MARKFTSKQFIAGVKAIKDKVQNYKDKLYKKEYGPMEAQFLRDNCFMQIGKCYDYIGIRADKVKYKRVLVVSRDVIFLSGEPVIRAGIWWLTAKGKCIKFDTLVPVSKYTFKLSKNQQHIKPE